MSKLKPILIERGILLNFALTPFWLPHPLLDELYCYAGTEWRFHAYKSLFVPGLTVNDRIKAHNYIASAHAPNVAKLRGRDLKPFDRVKWDRYSFNVMLTANLAKFTQNEKARIALKNTGDVPLFEHRRDKIWGDGKDGSGQNLQGKILEAIRGVI